MPDSSDFYSSSTTEFNDSDSSSDNDNSSNHDGDNDTDIIDRLLTGNSTSNTTDRISLSRNPPALTRRQLLRRHESKINKNLLIYKKIKKNQDLLKELWIFFFFLKNGYH